MARFFSNPKPIPALVADHISLPVNRCTWGISRRGYAAAAAPGVAATAAGGGGGGGGRSGAVVKKQGEQTGKATSSWVPDPVTGYYRPENLADEIDVVDLRNMLLRHKN
ncbi:protein SENESCENCE-ASSOCIATED GENE 21, mitochondrial-like [Malania oleifera]|uniref:protein SENESCENCE-ASSOCIATED GENE 21, mitochondrial-like n=1 Tax=Malania oleifera TaxID=397392 RepID=UPI0025ADE90C|nr:protein SENESCENCE-ASSOCIATED GENE 21, mitochondrial-like [Malania oleifera]